MDKTTKFQLIFLMIASFVSYPAQAAPLAKKIPKETTTNENSWFVGMGAGTAWTDLSNGYTTVSNGAPSPYDQDSFSIKTPASQTQLQFSAGYRWQTKKAFIPYYSAFFQYRRYLGTYIKGIIDQYSLPEFENYDYQMRYRAELFALNGKIDLCEYNHILPYLAAGAGIIYNRLNNYRETALPNVTARISPGYSGNTNTNLALTLGLGVDIKLTKNIWATVGYEYLSQGTVSTGNGETTWSGTHLQFGKNTKMSTVFLNVSVNVPDGIRSDK